jgi:tetratricopeptide (TPR) repeat protein
LADNYKYRAFISYSHSDEKWATWLHKALETYKIPKNIVGRETHMGEIPARLMPVFRDRDELPSATNLGELLTQSLVDSATQIVICSPAAAQSRWVNEEILTYKRLGRSHRIFCLIVDGEPWGSTKPGLEDQECFPHALRFEMGEDGVLSDMQAEPIAADARIQGDGKANARLKLISGMLGVGFDALKQREANRRHRRMLVVSTASFVGMAITSGLAVTAYLARIEAEEQRNRAQIEAETARQTTNFMVGLFEVSDPSESLGNTITAREILDKGAERIDTELVEQPEIQATLMDTMGTVYTSLGLYPEAARLVDKSVQKRRELFGDAHPEVAASLTHLGEVQTLSADYEQAERNLRDSLEMRRAAFGGSSDEVAESLTRLGDVLYRQGEFDEAGSLFADALRIRRLLYEVPDAGIAESLEDIGLNELERGDYKQAEAYLRDAVAMRRELHGDAHPSLAESINNLAWAVFSTGNLEEAERLLIESLAMTRELLGEIHPELAVALNNIAYVLEQRGQYQEAETNYRKALAMYRELLGDDHPEVARSMSNLAFVLYAKGERAMAIEQMRGALQIYREAVGLEHPDTASTAAGLGFWLIEQRSYEESEILLQESLDVRRKILGDSHPQTALTLTFVAYLLIETGRYEDALDYSREAQAIFANSLPEGDWRISFARSAEGSVLAAIGDYEGAEPLLLASLPGLEQAPIPGLADKGRRRLADLYLALGQPDKAVGYQAKQN